MLGSEAIKLIEVILEALYLFAIFGMLSKKRSSIGAIFTAVVYGLFKAFFTVTLYINYDPLEGFAWFVRCSVAVILLLCAAVVPCCVRRGSFRTY
jgi:hypothetical protein